MPIFPNSKALLRLRAIAAKIRRVFQSDLVLRDKFRYLADELALRFQYRSGAGLYEYALSGGDTISLRKDSTDRKVFDEVFLERIYAPFARLIPVSVDPHVLVDLGANIGLSAIFLARQLQVSSLVAVEPDLENFELLEDNLRHCGLIGPFGRLHKSSRAVEAFAGAERGFAQVIDSGNGAWGFRMGKPTPQAHSTPADDSRHKAFGTNVPVLPLSDLIPPPDPALPWKGVILKCDIEGAERDVFSRILDWDYLVDFIILELHTEFYSARQMRQALKESHYEWHMHGQIAHDTVLSVVALERRQRKAEPAPEAMPEPVPNKMAASASGTSSPLPAGGNIWVNQRLFR